MSARKILIVDDEPSVLRMLEIGLQGRDYDIRTAGSGLDALAVARQWQPNLVLLDVLMSDVDGHEVCRRLRQFSSAPVLLLTALRHEHSAVQGLEAGADEYITKPFSVAGLNSRVQTVLRQGERLPSWGPEPKLSCDQGKLTIDFARRLVHRGGRVVPLSNVQFRLLAYLAANPGRVLPYHELLEQIWGPDHSGDVSRLQTDVALLRRRVEENPQRPRLIALIEDVGVQFTGS